MEDIESYLSVFKRKEGGKSQIDWAKLMESPSQDVGEGIMLNFEATTGTSTFLKPKPAQQFSRDRGTESGEVMGGDNSLQNVGGRQKHPQLATKTHHQLRAMDAQSLETSSWNSISAEAFDTSSLTEVGTEHSGALEGDQLCGSDLESDGGRNPLANIKMAEDFFLTGDENGKRSAQLDRKRSSTDMKGSKPQVVQSENEETESESEQFQLTRNVFSIDQLKAVASDEEDEEINSDESCAGEDSKTDDSSINVHTLNNLDTRADKTTEPTSGFRSGGAGSGTSAEERNLKTKPAVKVYPGNQAEKVEPCCAGGYSDEEFESLSESSNGNVVEEEDIAEELSESNSVETETQMNVKSESDVENSQDTNTEDSTRYEENPSESGRYLPGSGGRRFEDYSDCISENTAQKSHTPNERGLSSSPCRTSIINQDHSDDVSTLNSKEHGSLQPSLAAQEQSTLHELLYGREYLDPPPIAPHVVSATALEAMAVHSPAIGALNKLLLSQIALIQQFLATSRRATEQLSSSIESGYQYTTLEETKEYIAKHRPKVLTTKEARKLVEMEEHRRY